MLFGMNRMPGKSQDFRKVAECLFSYRNKLRYGLVKVNDKQDQVLIQDHRR